MISVFNNKGKYILVTNLRQLDYELDTPGRARTGPVQMTFDTCWDGEKWVHGAKLGMTFATREEAAEYQAAHQEKMTEYY